MKFLITLFVCSTVAMLVMVIVKLIEVRSGRRFAFLHWRHKSDHMVRRMIVKIKGYIALKKVHGYVFLIKALRMSIDLLMKMRQSLLTRFAKFIDMVKGKGDLGNRGSASFFIHSISKNRNEEGDKN